MIRAGHCTACGEPTWRIGTAQRANGQIRAGSRHLLWPDPASIYVQTWTPTGHTVGIGYCAACSPAVGDLGPPEVGSAPVVGHEAAKARYADWYSEQKGVFFRAWLADGLGYDGAARDALMQQWEVDRA